MLPELSLERQPHSLTARHPHRPPARSGGNPVLEKDIVQRWEHGALRRLAPKEHLFCEGDLKTHVFAVEEGVIVTYKVLSDGRRQVIGFSYPGDILGLGVPGEHAFSAQAAGSAAVRCLSAAALDYAAAHDAGLAMKLYEAVSADLLATCSLLISIGQGSAIERVASFLLTVYRRTRGLRRSPAVIELPMRRTDIADLLGLTIETVSRTLTKLRTMGVIDIARGTEVYLRDIPRLEELARG